MNKKIYTTQKHSNKMLLCLVLFISVLNAKAQFNLVPNYSFEDSVKCPKFGDNPLPSPWYNPTNFQNGVYLNACALDTFASVPYPYFCYAHFYQPAKTGNGYAAICYTTSALNWRYYLQTRLKDSLIKNKSYYCEFFVNLPNLSEKATNNIGLLLTPKAVYSDTISDPTGLKYIPANPQVLAYNNPIITDTLNWVKISGIYKSVGGEKFITIGNFKTDSQNDYLLNDPQSGACNSCYNIDDVSVIPLDSFCLKADAGKDITIKQGDSAFIGSYTNGIDSLLWLENGSIKKDSTRPGFYVHPSTNTFYVLQQTINGCFSSDTVFVNVLLPLKFISYSVSIPLLGGARGGLITNTWQTTNEINVSHFNIQRSTNGKDFTTIGKVVAQNKITNEYTFLDSPPLEGLGVVYYRIES